MLQYAMTIAELCCWWVVGRGSWVDVFVGQPKPWVVTIAF